MSTQSAFGTILIRRKNNERPSVHAPASSMDQTITSTIDAELRLRSMAKKIRIVEKLTGNPHLMVTGSPSLAVRMYNIHDVQRLEKEVSSDENSHDDTNGGVDGLKHLRTSYEHVIVFFILSSVHQRDQLGRRDSFFHQAQRTNIRILIVTDVSQAISAMSSIVQSLAPEKREKKRNYFAQIAEQNYLPSSVVRGGVEPTQETIANHAKDTMIAWAERMEMQTGDVNVALDMMGSIAAVASASNRDLDNIPITTASKDVIRHFFGRIAREEKEGGVDNDNNPEEADSELFGDIDDSELLNIPDPSPVAAENDLDQAVYYQSESYDYDGYDLPQGGHGHSSYEQSSYQTQARDFYTPINPSFAHRHRRLDQVHQQDRHGSQYNYYPPTGVMEMNSNTGYYHPSGNIYSHHGEYDDYSNGYSRSVRQYTNQFM